MKLSSATHTIGDTSTPPTCVQMGSILWRCNTTVCSEARTAQHVLHDIHMLQRALDEALPINACQVYSSHIGSRKGRRIQRTGGIKRRVGPSIGSVGATDNAQGSFFPSICACT